MISGLTLLQRTWPQLVKVFGTLHVFILTYFGSYHFAGILAVNA